MLEKLTKDQEKLMDQVADEWIDFFYHDKTLDKKAAEEGIEYIYGLADLSKPEIVWCTSPHDCIEQAKKRVSEYTVLTMAIYGNVSDYNWFAFYDFFIRINVLKEDEEETQELKRYTKFLKSGIYDMIQLEELCFVCPKPDKIFVNERGDLHNPNNKAIEWSDGWGQYAVNGVIFEDEEWEEWRKADGKTIIKIDNADKRAAMISAVGMAKIMKDVKAKTISTDEYGELLELEGVIDGNDNPYRILKATDPAHGQEVFLRVPPTVETPKEAVAWSYGTDNYAPKGRV